MIRQQLPDLFLPTEYSSCRLSPASVQKAWDCDIHTFLVWIIRVSLTSFSPLLGACWWGRPPCATELTVVINVVMNPILTSSSLQASSLDDLHIGCQEGRLTIQRVFWRLVHGVTGFIFLRKVIATLPHLTPTKNRLLAPKDVTEEMFWNTASDFLLLIFLLFYSFFFPIKYLLLTLSTFLYCFNESLCSSWRQMGGSDFPRWTTGWWFLSWHHIGSRKSTQGKGYNTGSKRDLHLSRLPIGVWTD